MIFLTNFASFKHRQSWQRWEILFIVNWNNLNLRQSWPSLGYFELILHLFIIDKVGKFEKYFRTRFASFKYRQSWQSWEIFFLINWNNLNPRQSWGYFWTNFASFYNRQSWQSWEIFSLINWDNLDTRQSWQSWWYF